MGREGGGEEEGDRAGRRVLFMGPRGEKRKGALSYTQVSRVAPRNGGGGSCVACCFRYRFPASCGLVTYSCLAVTFSIASLFTHVGLKPCPTGTKSRHDSEVLQYPMHRKAGSDSFARERANGTRKSVRLCPFTLLGPYNGGNVDALMPPRRTS